MKNTDVPAVIYNVGELKAAFEDVRAERVKNMQKAPLPATPSSPCLSTNAAAQACKSLGLLKAYFNDTDYIGLTAVPCELATSADTASKPFHTLYVENNWRLVSATEAEDLTEIVRSPR